MQKPRTRPFIVRFFVIGALLASMMTIGSGVAQASTTCGVSGGHTLCVTVPNALLTGPAAITVTNSANNGTVIATWIPSGKPAINLSTKSDPSAQTNDYSFVWPTQKYLDATGVLRLQSGSTGSSQVNVPVTPSNGNSTDFRHSPNDWATFLPAPWTQPTDPVVAAVGDGPDGGSDANAVAQSIALTDPDLFLFLGDLNHYGQNSMDGGPGTLWGQMGSSWPSFGTRGGGQDYFHESLCMRSHRGRWPPRGLRGKRQYNVQSVLTRAALVSPPTLRSTPGTTELRAGDVEPPPERGRLGTGRYTTIQYKPLKVVSAWGSDHGELVNGAGGHAFGGAFTGDSRVEWSVGKTGGAISLTLDGAANGEPTSLSWATRTQRECAHPGTRNCGGAVTTPAISDFSPLSGPVGTSVTINGSGFTGSTGELNGTSVGRAIGRKRE